MSNSKDSLNRSDIESSLIKEFPNLTKAQISKSIDVIIDHNKLFESSNYNNKVLATIPILPRSPTVSYTHLTLPTKRIV